MDGYRQIPQEESVWRNPEPKIQPPEGMTEGEAWQIVSPGDMFRKAARYPKSRFFIFHRGNPNLSKAIVPGSQTALRNATGGAAHGQGNATEFDAESLGPR